MDTILNFLTSIDPTKLVLTIREYLSITYDYVYILLLKYFILIAENYILYFSVTIPLLLFLYLGYNKIMYQKSSVFGYIGLLLILPFSIIIYSMKFLNACFDKYIYYKLFNVDYLQDVPRKKRDYILEKTIRSKMNQSTKVRITE